MTELIDSPATTDTSAEDMAGQRAIQTGEALLAKLKNSTEALLMDRASSGNGGPDPEARAHMVLAAYMGGLALNAGMVLGHSIAYTLANRLHLPHGLSCAIALQPRRLASQPPRGFQLDQVVPFHVLCHSPPSVPPRRPRSGDRSCCAATR